MKKLFRYIAWTLCMALALIAPGAALAETAAPALSEYFTDRDLSGEWSDAEAIEISLEGASAQCASGAVAIDGGTVTISAAGTYVLSGALEDGSIVVNVDSADKVQLVLNGVSITSSDSAAILVENADKVFITLAEGTENVLSNGGSFGGEDGVDAVIFARDDIAFNGTGALTINSPVGHGIVGKDDVKFASGSYVITAAGRGIDANDSVRIASGSFVIEAGKDGIRAKNDEDTSKGYVVIFDGSFKITTGGGAENGATHTDGMMGFGGQAASADEGNSTSAKGIKASGNLSIYGGTFDIDSADDAFHSDADMTIAGGSFAAASGDDGFHANDALLISGGEINISRSYEGLEGHTITVTGGSISLVASDDGMNAAGGNDGSGYGFYDMFASDSDARILISGGTIYVNASGDGIDSNGDLVVSGGTIVVSGPTNSGNGALDCDGNAAITGGTLIATGAAGMAENFGGASTQVSILASLSGQAGEISVRDSSGNVLLSGTVEKNFECVVVSSPDLVVGETYTIASNSSSTEIAVSSTITGSGMGMGMGGGMGGMGGFQRGGMENAGAQGASGQGGFHPDGMRGQGGMRGGMGQGFQGGGQLPPELPDDSQGSGN